MPPVRPTPPPATAIGMPVVVRQIWASLLSCPPPVVAPATRLSTSAAACPRGSALLSYRSRAHEPPEVGGGTLRLLGQRPISLTRSVSGVRFRAGGELRHTSVGDVDRSDSGCTRVTAQGHRAADCDARSGDRAGLAHSVRKSRTIKFGHLLRFDPAEIEVWLGAARVPKRPKIDA